MVLKLYCINYYFLILVITFEERIKAKKLIESESKDSMFPSKKPVKKGITQSKSNAWKFSQCRLHIYKFKVHYIQR